VVILVRRSEDDIDQHTTHVGCVEVRQKKGKVPGARGPSPSSNYSPRETLLLRVRGGHRRRARRLWRGARAWYCWGRCFALTRRRGRSGRWGQRPPGARRARPGPRRRRGTETFCYGAVRLFRGERVVWSIASRSACWQMLQGLGMLSSCPSGISPMRGGDQHQGEASYEVDHRIIVRCACRMCVPRRACDAALL